MAQLYLPTVHNEADLVLAGQIAEAVESAELYVAWTSAEGQAAPAVAAELRDPLPSWTDTLALVFAVMRELWTALLSRPAHAQVAPPARAGELPAQPKPAAGA